MSQATKCHPQQMLPHVPNLTDTVTIPFSLRQTSLWHIMQIQSKRSQKTETA